MRKTAVATLAVQARVDRRERAHGARGPGARLELLRLPLDGRDEPEVVEHAGAKLGGDPPYLLDDLVGHLRHRRQLRQQRLLRELARLRATDDPGDVHLERGERLPELVVDLARNAGALVLAHRLDVRRELAELVLQLPALDRDPRDVRGALEDLHVVVERGGFGSRT